VARILEKAMPAELPAEVAVELTELPSLIKKSSLGQKPCLRSGDGYQEKLSEFDGYSSIWK